MAFKAVSNCLKTGTELVYIGLVMVVPRLVCRVMLFNCCRGDATERRGAYSSVLAFLGENKDETKTVHYSWAAPVPARLRRAAERQRPSGGHPCGAEHRNNIPHGRQRPSEQGPRFDDEPLCRRRRAH